MAGTVPVNLTPYNPYSVAALAVWRQGHFLNFNGLTRLTASLWPFLALARADPAGAAGLKPCLEFAARSRSDRDGEGDPSDIPFLEHGAR